MPPATSKEVVLVIDDDQMVGGSVKRILDRLYRVHLFSDARDALAWLEQNPPCDAIICDVMMPVMGGVEFLAAVKQKFPALAERIVFATGGAFTPEARHLAATTRFCIEKPFMPDALRATVRQVLGPKPR